VGQIKGWPVETQRVFCRVLDYFEKEQGYPLAAAESLAFATVVALMGRLEGPIALLARLPVVATQGIEKVRDAFGEDVAVSWRPYPSSPPKTGAQGS